MFRRSPQSNACSMKALLYALLLAAWIAPARSSAAPVNVPKPGGPVVYYDLTPLYALDIKDPIQRRRLWDEIHLVTSLQGLVNRDAPRLFIRHIKGPDDFWWEQMTQTGGWLAGLQVVRISNLEELLAHFAQYYRGAVIWDEQVPATSNLASTIAGSEDLLCLRYDPAENSVYRRLTEGGPRLVVKTRLLREDGSPLFTGKGTIPGTTKASTGSAKCDAYLWLIEQQVKTGKVNPQRMGYYLDAFWFQCWNAGGAENHTLANHDFVIAQKGLFFDLNVWEDETCVDDRGQKPGTDAATLKALLRAAYDRFGGDGMIHVAGFVPWAYKYTDCKGGWAAGGKHEAVPTEWKYAEILSCFNAYMDADALGLGAMANASFYQHYPLAKRYPQNPKPTRERLQAQGILDAQGRIARRGYIAHYVGDYDSAAWLYRELPRMWRDEARGSLPLSWAFNPNLCERFPLGMAWARQHQTTNDWFVAGDSGAGYLNPGWLTPPRPHSGLPSGLAAWERHCRRFYEQWDLSLTGFVIDGFGPGLSPEGLDAYSRFSPDGIVAQKIPSQGVHQGMPYIRMRTDLDGAPGDVAQTLFHLASGAKPRFMVCRSILKSPKWYADVSRELAKLAGDQVQVVDMHTLLWLVREYQTNRAYQAESAYAQAAEISGRPNQPRGLSALHLADGPFQVTEVQGIPCWKIPKHQPGYYFYVDVDDQFLRPDQSGALRIELEYLDRGQGALVLEYDSRDAAAAHSGIYKSHPQAPRRTDSGAWRTATFAVSDARFAGSQNGEADFRFFNAGDDLIVKTVRVRRGN